MHQRRKSKRIDAESNQDKHPTWHSNRGVEAQPLCSQPYPGRNCQTLSRDIKLYDILSHFLPSIFFVFLLSCNSFGFVRKGKRVMAVPYYEGFHRTFVMHPLLSRFSPAPFVFGPIDI